MDLVAHQLCMAIKTKPALSISLKQNMSTILEKDMQIKDMKLMLIIRLVLLLTLKTL